MNISLSNITSDNFNHVSDEINKIHTKINNINYDITLTELKSNNDFNMVINCNITDTINGNITSNIIICNDINISATVTSIYNKYSIIKLKCNNLLQYEDVKLDYNIYLIFNENELISHRYKLLNNIKIDDKIIMKNIINNYIAPHIIKLRV
jgi:hypothetical protein